MTLRHTLSLKIAGLLCLFPYLSANAESAAADETTLLVHRAEYAVRLADDGARVEAQFDTERIGRDAASVLLLAGDLAIEPADLPAGARLEQVEKGYRLTITRRRRLRITLSFTARVTHDGLWRETRFVGPANAAIAVVHARVAGADMDLQLAEGILETTGVRDRETYAHGFLEAGPSVRLRWRDRTGEAARQTLLACKTVAEARIEPGVIKTRTDLTYEILQGTVPRLDIALPPGHTLTRIEGEAIRDWQLAAADGADTRLSVEFLEPQEGRLPIAIFTEYALDSLPAIVALRIPQPLGTERENGLLRVTAEDMTFEPEPPPELRQVPADAPALAAYRFHVRPVSLRATLNRIVPTVHAADRATFRIEDGRVRATHALRLTVENAGVYSLDVEPLGDWTVTDVRGRHVKDWQTEDGLLRVRFARRLQGYASLTVHREFVRTDPNALVALDALRIVGAASESANIGVVAARGMQVRTADTVGLREIPASGPESRRDQRLAFRAEQPDWSLGLSVERETPRLLADIFHVIAIGDGVAGGSAAVRYAILRQGVQELRLRVPPEWNNVDFVGPNIRRQEQDGDVWTIGLQEKVWGGYTLVVAYDMAFDPHGAVLRAGGLHALDVERETGAVAIGATPSLKLTEQNVKARSPSQLFRIDEADLAPGDRALLARPALLAYRYSGQDYELTVQTERFAQVPALQAVADLAQLATVLTPDGQALTQASFMLKNQDMPFQRFRLPPGATFWSCHAGDEPVIPTRDGDDILVPLPRLPDRDRAFPVEIVYAESIGALDSAPVRRLRLNAPETDVQTVFARWELYVPATHALTRFAGSMNIAHGTSYGLREAWNQFYRFYDSMYAFFSGAAAILLILAGFVALAVLAVRRRWKGVLALFAVGFVLLIFAGMLLPAVSSSRERARRTSAMSQLAGLGRALILYSMDRNGLLPANLDELYATGLTDTRAFRDPVSGLPFTYVAGGRNIEDLPANSVVAYSPARSGGRNVLHADGSVQWMSEAEFDTALARLPSPPPAPPSPAPPPAEPDRVTEEELMRRMKAIEIPEIEFKQANILDVMRFLQKASVEFDRATEDSQRVNIVLNLGLGYGPVSTPSTPDPFATAPAADDPFGMQIQDYTPLITFSASHISLYEAVRIVTEIAGLKFRIEGNVVMIVPIDAPDGEILQRAYDVDIAFANMIPRLQEELQMVRDRFAPGDMGAGDVRAASMDLREVFRQLGVPWPAGSSVRYVPSLGKLIVSNTGNNLKLMEDILPMLHAGVEESMRRDDPPPPPALAAPRVAGLRSLRIDVPRSGARYEFAKTLDTRRQPLTIRATAVRATTLSVWQGIGLLATFLVGLALARRGLQPPRESARRAAAGIFLAVGSVVGVLLISRLLGAALIALPPLALLALFAWLRRRRKSRATPPSLPPSEPTAPSETTPAAVASRAMLMLAIGLLPAGSANARADDSHMSVRATRIEGEVRDNTARLSAEFDIVAENIGSSGAHIALLGNDTAVSSFRTRSRHLSLIRSQHRLEAQARRNVSDSAHVQFLARVGGDAARRTLIFATPPALSTRLTLLLPEPDAHVEAPGAVSLRTVAQEGNTRIEALFGPADRIELAWQPRGKRAADTAASVFCRHRTAVTIGGGAINTRAELTIQITQGETTETRIAVPPGQRVLRVDGEGLRTWSLREEAGTNLVVAAWAAAVTEQASIVVETERILGALPAELDLRIPRALDAQRESGWLALVTDEDMALSVHRSEGLQKAEADEFPAAREGELVSLPRPAAVYRFFASDIRLGARVEQMEPVIEANVINHLLIGYDRLTLAARVRGSIRQAGVFSLRLGLPNDYAVTSVRGTRVARWDERTGENGRELLVRLTERTLGPLSLDIRMHRWLPELPESVSVAGIEPLDADQLNGHLKIGTELGLQARVAEQQGLTETPAATVDDLLDGGLLAYQYARKRGEPARPWTLRLALETIQPWLRAETVQWLRLNANEFGLAHGKAKVRFEVRNAPVKDFRLKMPAPFRNVEVVGQDIRRRDESNGVWRVELQSRKAGTVEFHIAWDQPYDADSPLDVRPVEALDVERASGYVALLARPPLQTTDLASEGDLVRLDEQNLPDWATGPDGAEGALAWRYWRPDWRLTAGIVRRPDAEALGVLIDSARFATTVAEDGQTLTEMALYVRHAGQQHLEVALPPGARLWTAFVDGQAVRPSQRNGILQIPLERHSDRPSRVEAVYAGETPFPSRRGSVAMSSPSFAAPVKDAAWDLYLPPGYAYSRFGGSMTHARQAEAERRALLFSMGEYIESEGRRAAARAARMDARLHTAESLVRLRDLKDASVVVQEIRQSELATDETTRQRVQKLEGDLKQAQAWNVLESQRSFVNLNLAAELHPAMDGTDPFAPEQGLADIREAARQYDRVQKAQELALARTAPLHVTLPRQGVRHGFIQALQTEAGRPMTVRMRAASARGVSPLAVLLGGGALFLALWIGCAFVLSARSSKSQRG